MVLRTKVGYLMLIIEGSQEINACLRLLLALGKLIKTLITVT